MWKVNAIMMPFASKTDWIIGEAVGVLNLAADCTPIERHVIWSCAISSSVLKIVQRWGKQLTHPHILLCRWYYIKCILSSYILNKCRNAVCFGVGGCIVKNILCVFLLFCTTKNWSCVHGTVFRTIWLVFSFFFPDSRMGKYVKLKCLFA